jgi:hypothetical protein
MDDVAPGESGTFQAKRTRPTKRQRAAAERTAAERTAAENAATERASTARAIADIPAIPTVDAPAAPSIPEFVATPMEAVSAADVQPASLAEDGTSIHADRVEMRLSAVGRVEGGELIVEQGAVGAARADRVSIDRGALGAAMAGNVELSRGYARSILARQVQLDRSAARIVIAADVRANQSAAMFLVARKVDGNVKVLFDWRGALAFGAVAGIVFALLGRARGARRARLGRGGSKG